MDLINKAVELAASVVGLVTAVVKAVSAAQGLRHGKRKDRQR